MAKFSLLKNVFLIGCVASALSFVHSQGTIDEDTTKLPQLEINQELFTKPEINILQTSEAVSISPLTLARRLQNAWLLGRKEAMVDLAKNATSPGLGLNVDRLIDLNNGMEFTITPSELEDEMTKAYQLGGLTFINTAMQRAQKRLPEIRPATHEEVRIMRMKQQEAVRRALRAQRMKSRLQPRWQLRSSQLGLASQISPANVAEEQARMKYQFQYSPIEHSSGLSSLSEIDSEEEESIDLNEFDINSIDSSFGINDLNDDFETNQDDEDGSLCPPAVSCRNCKDRRYRNCRQCRDIATECERKDVEASLRP